MNTHVDGFDWDNANTGKCQKHGVSVQEIESVFAQEPSVFVDTAHSQTEARSMAIGRNQDGRHIFIVFTIRKKDTQTYIRPISARYMHQKEITQYMKYDV